MQPPAGVGFLRHQRDGQPPVVVLADDLLRPALARPSASLQALVARFTDVASVLAPHAVDEPPMHEAAPFSTHGLWERRAAQVAGWLEQQAPAEGVHLAGAGDGVLLACELALHWPRLVASLTLIQPSALQRGADALGDAFVAQALAGEAGGDDPQLVYALALERKRHVRQLLGDLARTGVSRPVLLLCTDPLEGSHALLEVFDLFAGRQSRTVLKALPPADARRRGDALAHALSAFIESVPHG